MLPKAVGLFTCAVLALLSSVVLINHSQAQEAGRKSSRVIPKTWDDQALADLEVPLPDPAGSPRNVPSEYYYRIRSGPYSSPIPSTPPDMSRQVFGSDQAATASHLWDDFDQATPKERCGLDEAGKAVFDAPIGYRHEQPNPGNDVGIQHGTRHRRISAKDGTIPDVPGTS